MSKSLDEYLNEVDYKFISSNKYIPSRFALEFINFIKLVNGPEGEENKTPAVHLVMLDKIANRSGDRLANLCHRGLAKTTLFGEYLILYLAMYNKLPKFKKTIKYVIYVADTMENGAKSLRRNLEHRYEKSEFLKKYIPHAIFTDPYIEFQNLNGQQLAVKLYGATSGIRGSKVFNVRPSVAILDDLLSDEASKSKTTMALIKETVFSGVNYALDPVENLTIFNGTPFNKEDVLVQAVESGAWEVNVFPVCEKFPCEPHEFSGSWEDRFSYDYVRKQYENNKKEGKLSSFYQEMMLRLSTDDERLVQDNDIQWYDLNLLLKYKNYYNFYITTDFATSSKESADYSVISVWAYNANGDWYLVDGVCRKRSIDLTFDDLFMYAQKYNPQSVGIEITGQQGAYINFLKKEMVKRNIYFNFARNKNSKEPGIRPITDKLSRFNLIVPLFKERKIYFPRQKVKSDLLMEMLLEISLATVDGFKGKDDCLDTISMLGLINAFKPSAYTETISDPLWDDDLLIEPETSMKSYLV